MTDVSVEALESEAQAIRDAGGTVLAMPLDVADADAWSQVVDRTVEEFGKIDVLVSNAGVHKRLIRFQGVVGV